uniref:Uncharacterized protein n=1 Tax=Aureoumbra lagunensis TaxID=44058 RepID=A0A7S3JYQ7_9STRA|mmetsp:Transcript_17466/g.26271  ORF Transcript_17466/g.26271 Transcript_17466/m.26271 type:complete len:476 (+) Transcript_17466:16-1443(+)
MSTRKVTSTQVLNEVQSMLKEDDDLRKAVDSWNLTFRQVIKSLAKRFNVTEASVKKNQAKIIEHMMKLTDEQGNITDRVRRVRNLKKGDKLIVEREYPHECGFYLAEAANDQNKGSIDIYRISKDGDHLSNKIETVQIYSPDDFRRVSTIENGIPVNKIHKFGQRAKEFAPGIKLGKLCYILPNTNFDNQSTAVKITMEEARNRKIKWPARALDASKASGSLINMLWKICENMQPHQNIAPFKLLGIDVYIIAHFDDINASSDIVYHNQDTYKKASQLDWNNDIYRNALNAIQNEPPDLPDPPEGYLANSRLLHDSLPPPSKQSSEKKRKKKAPPNESHPHDVPVTKRHKKPRFEKHNLQEINNQVSSINIPQTVAPQTSSPGNKILPPSPQLSGILRKYSPKISEQLPSYGIHNLATFCMHSSIRDILEDSLDVKHLTASRLINEVNTAYQASLSSPTSLPLFDSLHTSIAGLY